ncbi:MAG TPA: ATP-binding protein [Amnibacterium sp.]|jgi:signal transduction histidine kinase|uniref:sensor histidine kinase n=1 Tax=Amnibacterium sp. TaxID=1872496 RepID=UPI002F94AD08
MERILKQRDRLLAESARLIGLTSTVVAFLLLVLGGMTLPALLLALPFFALLAGAQVRMGQTKAVEWPIATIVLGLAAVILLRCEAAGAFTGWTGLAGTAELPLPLADAMRVLTSGAIAAAAVLLTISLGRMLVLVGAFAVTMIVVVVVFAGQTLLGLAALSTIAGWSGLVAAGAVLSAGLLRAARRVSSIGRAHRSERQASETEAQRRQGARLLHDTVLATLTLLAHSGVGVSRDALRRQAGDDARLLRQLRLSASPLSVVSGPSADDEGTSDGATADPGDSLESVRQRFERLGLEVSWHGATSVSLPPQKLDRFLLALGECLENVRRHSGVKEAHVTITDDETTVRALVTDNGVGFEPAAVPAGKLGYRESIVARLTEMGGNARVFSAQGSGTTVVLEVPR